MQNKSQIWRFLLLPLFLGILLGPATMTALTWTSVDFIVTYALILAVVATYYFVMPLRWYIVVLAALTIALPPYPYLTDFNEVGQIVIRGADMYFPVALYSLVAFSLALLCFKSIFWILSSVRRPA
ncbi:MAG: hypothetical protein WCC39_10905 [Telluria sp.]